MRILFLTMSCFSKFPTYKRAVGMGEALAKMGHEVAIAALDCRENRDRMGMEAPHCVPLWFSGRHFMQEVVSKIRAVWRYRPEVLYLTSYSPRNLAFARRLLPRKMLTVVEFCELYSEYGDTQRWWKFVEKFAVKESSRILCASTLLRDRFHALAHALHRKDEVLYLPYAYPSYLIPRKELRSRKSIVFMAALWRNYGVYDVISACERLLCAQNDVDLEIVGGGPEIENVRRLVSERRLVGRIFVRGYVPEEELNEIFSRASVFVAPLHDTLQDRVRCPSKVFYYIPYNKPIVTCRLGDPEVTLGSHGYYYEPENVEDMARTIEAALSSSETFTYPDGYIAAHSWEARAVQFEKWIHDYAK